MPLGTEVGLGPDNIVLDGDPAFPSPKRGRSLPLQFSAHVYCGQTAAWIKMPHDTEVGLGPGHIVLDGDPATLPQKWAEPPLQFSAHVYCGQTAGCIKTALGMEVGLGPDHIVLDGGSSLPKKGLSPLPNFRPISIVAKQLDASKCNLVWR